MSAHLVAGPAAPSLPCARTAQGEDGKYVGGPCENIRMFLGRAAIGGKWRNGKRARLRARIRPDRAARSCARVRRFGAILDRRWAPWQNKAIIPNLTEVEILPYEGVAPWKESLCYPWA